MRKIIFICLTIPLAFGLSQGLWAQNTQGNHKPQDLKALKEEITRLRRELNEEKENNATRIKSLEEQIQALQDRMEAGEAAGAGEADEEAGALDALLEDLGLEGEEDELDSLLGDLTGKSDSALSTGMPSFTQSIGSSIQSMNPKISVIGDFIGHYTDHEGGELDDEFLFRELEIGFSAYVDPYARADFFLGMGQDETGEWEIELEEGYATFLSIPYDLQPRIGKFRSTFGKANPVHLHALPWVEYPQVLQNYFGDDGLDGTGAGVSWLVPNPWDAFMELTYEITNNDNDLFGGSKSDDFMHLIHLKNFIDLSEASTLEAGVSFATAPNDRDHGPDRTQVEGLDLTYRWRPPQTALYNSFLWQTEVLLAQVDQEIGDENSYGLYSAVEYQFARRWSAGSRYDYSEMPENSHSRENGYNVYLTFIQSEFLFWRLAYRYTDRNFYVNGDKDEHEVFLQCNFGIGPHRAHTY